MNEAAKFEVYKKKLQGICEENNLVYTLTKDRYPITLTIRTTGDMDGQISMLENVEEDGYRSPDARLILAFKDGALVYQISETFTIGEALFSKLKNIFKNMHALWLQYFHRDIIEREALPARQMPVIDDGEDDGGDIPDEAFSELGDDMTRLESFDEDDDADADGDTQDDSGDYGYGDPEDGGGPDGD